MGNINNILHPPSFNNNYDIAIIGGGPGGIMAAISARHANPKSRICILEKNNNLGRKLLLTGNGRCNFTTSLDLNELINSFGKRGRFFFEAFNSFSNKDLIEFFKVRGLLPLFENDYKVFPKNGNSLTVLNCLKDELSKANVDIHYNFEVSGISKILTSNVLNDCDYSERKSSGIEHFRIDSNLKSAIFSKKIIVSTGGLSYPQTGSRGDGYKIAQTFGHSILDLSPSLVAIMSDYLSSLKLKGISIKNAALSVMTDGRIEDRKTGDLIFTHFGISGPSPLSLGNIVYKLLKNRKEVIGNIDFSPDISIENILKKYEEMRNINSKKEIISIMKVILHYIPGELILKLFEISVINPHQKTGNIKNTEIMQFLNITKNFTFKIDGALSINEAIVTEGGIPVKEINPKSMESRLIKNLYFAGEIIEMQGPEGGFNLQKAFSTGWLAGKSAALNLP
jgi:predicted Rossmann fold flavoprotein